MLDLVWGDYDNLFHQRIIFAPDVTYLAALYDVDGKHIYLSVITDHRSKKVIGQKVFINNDIKLVLDYFASIANKPANVIVHSDYGSCYFSILFCQLIHSSNWKQSMSRAGNSLDNHVVEFWFSILKTEFIYNIDVKKMSFEQVLANYIDYYNNVRIQKIKFDNSYSIWK